MHRVSRPRTARGSLTRCETGASRRILESTISQWVHKSPQQASCPKLSSCPVVQLSSGVNLCVPNQRQAQFRWTRGRESSSPGLVTTVLSPLWLSHPTASTGPGPPKTVTSREMMQFSVVPDIRFAKNNSVLHSIGDGKQMKNEREEMGNPEQNL